MAKTPLSPLCWLLVQLTQLVPAMEVASCHKNSTSSPSLQTALPGVDIESVSVIEWQGLKV